MAAVALAGLDLLPFGFVVCEGRNRPVSANAAGRAMLDADPHTWRRLMAEAIQQGRACACVRDGRPTAIAVPVLRDASEAPPAGEPAGAACLAACFLFEPGRLAPVNLDLLQAAYQLSNAEARIAGVLLNGMGVEEAAESLHVSSHTVRSHLKRIFAKTRTRTQSQLLRLLIGSGVLLAIGSDSNFLPL